MKRVKGTVFIVLFFLMISCLIQSANAQLFTRTVTEPGDITLSLGISNGTSVGHLEESEIGITAGLYYGIMEEIRGGFNYTYYFIGESGLSANEINLDGHYFFRNRDNVIVYGLGGINIARVQGDDDVWDNPDSRRFGLNAGIGIEFEVGDISIFGESKFTLGGWSQFLLTGGARFRL